MNLWRRSLREDAVDRYNHTWSVLLLLLLSLITWLVPFNFTRQFPEVTTKKSLTSSTQQVLPQYQASCWCPEHFTSSQVIYVNKVCAANFNNALHGRRNNGTLSGVYAVMDPLSNDFRSSSWLQPNVQKDNQKSSQHNGGKFVDTSMRSVVRDLLAMTTPLMLFMFAVCLKLPHIIWHLLSSCTTLNVDRTLETAELSQHLSLEDRRQLNQDLLQATADTVRSSPRSASLAYMLFKVLVCVVVIGEVVVVMQVALPQVRDAKTKVVAEYDQELYKVLSKEKQEMPKEDESQATDYNGITLLCDFSILQLQNIGRFTVQCVYMIDPSASDAGSPSSGYTEQTGLSSYEKTWLSLYETLFTALLAYLILLLFVDIINTLTWISKLFLGPCRGLMIKDQDVPLDIYLLLLMSRENASSLVTHDLSHYSTWSNRQDPENEKLREL